MNQIQPIVAYVTINDEPTSFPALSVDGLLDRLTAYAMETEEEWVAWMKEIPTKKEIETAISKLQGANSIVIEDKTIGDWDESIKIELMPQWWVDALITPFVSQVETLAGELSSMIGHPENPFAENILDDLVVGAFNLIGKERPDLIDYKSDDI